MVGDGNCRDCGHEIDRDDLEAGDGRCGGCNPNSSRHK